MLWLWWTRAVLWSYWLLCQWPSLFALRLAAIAFKTCLLADCLRCCRAKSTSVTQICLALANDTCKVHFAWCQLVKVPRRKACHTKCKNFCMWALTRWWTLSILTYSYRGRVCCLVVPWYIGSQIHVPKDALICLALWNVWIVGNTSDTVCSQARLC